MVDPVDLLLAEDLADLPVQAGRRVQVASEWLFDDDPTPASAVDLVIKTHPAQLADDLGEGRRLGGQVEQSVASRTVLEVDRVEAGRQPVERLVVPEVALVVDDPGDELVDDRRLEHRGLADRSEVKPFEEFVECVAGVCSGRKLVRADRIVQSRLCLIHGPWLAHFSRCLEPLREA